MELVPARPSTEAAQLAAASLQNVRFKERRLRDAESVVRNEVVYFSPVIRIDRATSAAIIQYRDGATGEVKREYSPDQQYGAYVQAAEKEVVEQPERVVVEKVEVQAEPEQPSSVDEDA